MLKYHTLSSPDVQGLSFIVSSQSLDNPAYVGHEIESESNPIRARLEAYAQLAHWYFNAESEAVRQKALKVLEQLLPGFHLTGVAFGEKAGVAQVSRMVMPVDITNDFMILHGDIRADQIFSPRLQGRPVYDRYPIYHRFGTANPFTGVHAFAPKLVGPGEELKDFWGTLSIPGAQALIPAMAEFMAAVRSLTTVPIAFAVDGHEVDDDDFNQLWPAAALFNRGQAGPWPYHNMVGTVGQQMVHEVWAAIGADRMEIWPKKLFNAFHTDYARQRVQRLAINEVVLFGVAREICDTESAMGAQNILVNRQHWPMSVVLAYDLTKELDAKRSDLAMRDLHKRGVFFSTSAHLKRWLLESHVAGNIAPSIPFMALRDAAALIKGGMPVAQAVDEVLEYRPSSEQVTELSI